MRVPTARQFGFLLKLGSGAAGLSWPMGPTEQLLRHGWVTAEKFDGRYYQLVRITPDGLRALAAAVERYGLPALWDEDAGSKEAA